MSALWGLVPGYARRMRISLVLLFCLLFAVGCSDETEQATTRTFVVGLITNNPNGLRNVQGFRDGLSEAGYIEGENLRYLDARKPVEQHALVSEIEAMIASGADLIFTAGTPTGVAAWQATRNEAVPVVFGVIADPLSAGVMTDLSRPGGNMTGVMLSSNQGRRLELLSIVVPGVHKILVPYNPEDPAPTSAATQLSGTSATLGLELVHVLARNNDEVSALLTRFPRDIDAVFMLPDSTVNRRAKDLLALTSKRKLPVSGPSVAQVEAGALMSYGIAHHAVGLQAAQIADRILRGDDPSGIPVETAEFFLTINIAAAKRIGIELSEEVLQQADLIVREDRFGQ